MNEIEKALADALTHGTGMVRHISYEQFAGDTAQVKQVQRHRLTREQVQPLIENLAQVSDKGWVFSDLALAALISEIEDLVLAAQPVQEEPAYIVKKDWQCDEVLEPEAGIYSQSALFVRLTEQEIVQAWDAHIVPVFGKSGINVIVFANTVQDALIKKNGGVV